MSADKDREARRQVLHNRLRELNGAIALGEARVGREKAECSRPDELGYTKKYLETRAALRNLRAKRAEVLNELNNSYKGDTKID